MNILKKITIVNTIIIAILTLSAFLWTGCAQEKKEEKPASGNGLAVLELFTSEGCSSCPPAEDLMARIKTNYPGKPLFILEYHVDYFDNLGWKDVFGSPENTQRQKRYSKWLNAQVYTPQLVVNGSQEFIGSDEGAARKAITIALSSKHNTDLSLQVHREAESLKIDYEAKDTQKNDDVFFALVQKKGSTDIKRGENAGLKLSHVQIVRKSLTISLKEVKSGTAAFSIPKNSTEQWEIIAMIQDRTTGKISAAKSLDI